MESKNNSLGDDMRPDETMPDAEQPTAEPQEQPEAMATNENPPSEDEASAALPTPEDEAAAAVEEDEDAEGDDVVFDMEDDEPDDDDEEEDEAEEDQGAEEPPVRKGQIVDGTVLETSPTEVLIDLGEELVGVVASRELERMDRSALEALSPGSSVTAYVLKARGADGRPVLSLARAEEETNWRLAEAHFQNQDVYFSKVAGYNKGGLIVRFGKVRGFVPASQVSRDRQRRAVGESPEERWGGMVGEDIAVKVVEIDRGRNRLILSERAAAREWREQQKARLLKDLTVGEIRTGRVISLADFGAFVDLGGADGLVHLTEISWKHVTHPREVLDVGQEVEVEVISIDPDRKRIGLSMKRLEHDPWEDVVAQYRVGQLVQATVTKLTKFGAFARLVDSPEIEGLIHISELADYRVSHPREVVLVGDVLTLRIVKIDADQRRLGLSLRQVDSAKYMDQDWQALVEDIEDDAEPAPDTPTLAERVDVEPEALKEELDVEEAPAAGAVEAGAVEAEAAEAEAEETPATEPAEETEEEAEPDTPPLAERVDVEPEALKEELDIEETPDVEEPGAEEPDVEEPDAKEPDAEEPDVEEPAAEASAEEVSAEAPAEEAAEDTREEADEETGEDEDEDKSAQ